MHLLLPPSTWLAGQEALPPVREGCLHSLPVRPAPVVWQRQARAAPLAAAPAAHLQAVWPLLATSWPPVQPARATTLQLAGLFPSGMRPDAVRLVNTPVFLHHRGRTETIRFPFPWRPLSPERQGKGPVEVLEVCFVAAGIRYEPVPLSPGDEAAFAAGVKAAAAAASLAAGADPDVVF